MNTKKIIFSLAMFILAFTIIELIGETEILSQPYNTITQIATAPKKTYAASQYSDVCISSRVWRQGMDGEPNTIEAIKNFHATRMEWMYTTQKELVDKIRDAGIQSVNLAIWAPEENIVEGGQGNEIRTCVINDNGEEVIVDGLMRNNSGEEVTMLTGRNWGCANNECHLEYIKYLVKRRIDAGADTIQFDNYRQNLFVKEKLEDSDKKICYCYFCQRDAELLGKSPDEIQDEFLVREFYDKLQMYTNEYIKDIDRLKNKNITQFRFSCNNYNVVWKHFNLEHLLFFIGMSEISERVLKSENEDAAYYMWKAYKKARDLGKAQIVTFVSTNVGESRKWIAFAYANGVNPIVPWDVYVAGATIEDHSANDVINDRYYGKYRHYADLYGFVRAIPEYLDGYEDAYVYEKGDIFIKDERYVSLSPTRQTGGDGRTYHFVRAKPGDPDAPVIIHIIEWWNCTQYYNIILNLERFFDGVPNQKIKVTFFKPRTYDYYLHKEAQETNDFSKLKTCGEKTPTYINPKQANIPMGPDDCSPWGILIVEKKITKNIFINAGWSMISLSVKPENPILSSLFPDAVVVYGYEKGIGYKRVGNNEALEVGQGYWILLNEVKTYTISGETIYSYTFDVNESGWLMIGGCTESGTKVSVDNGIIVVIYGYIQGAGYQRVTGETLESGQGYWILVNDIDEKAKLTVK